MVKVYTVHMRRFGIDPDTDIQLIKEGFSWGAFLFGPLWALWNGLWLSAIVLFAAQIVTGMAAALISPAPVVASLVGFGLQMLFAMVAFDLKRRKLAGQGIEERDVVVSHNADLAMRRYLDNAPSLAREFAR